MNGKAQVDLQLAQLWISFLCHELISPIGAINNGLEFLEDDQAGTRSDNLAMALDLMKTSSRQATLRLKYFRLALGRAGSDSDLGIVAAIELVVEHLSADSRVQFRAEAVPTSAPALAELTGQRMQLWLNLVLVAAACLQRGGQLTGRFGEDGRTLSLEACGKVARLDPVIDRLLQGSDEIEVTPRNCLARLCGILGQLLGAHIEVTETTDGPSATGPESVLFKVTF
ncbi:MAG: histidine phosphotransferase family protein [Alphaproteobacteria bacterium]|nr:histidine phosphotransferase family protein [Alphaproteobacteria bacterium]